MSILNYIEQMKDMYEGERIGTPTKEVTQHGRRIYETPEGNVSEKSRTFFLNGKWLNVPSIHEGKAFTDDQLRFMIKQGQIQPTSVHGSRIEAEAAAGQRSDMMKSHVKGFAEGQLVRNTVDGSRPGYQGKNQFTGNNPLNIKQSTYDLIPQIKEDAKTMSQIEVQNKHKIHKKTLKKIKDAENIKFRTTYLPEGTQKKSIPYAERYTAEEKSALYKKVKSRETEEDRIKAKERDAKYRDKIYKDYKMEPSSRSVYDDLWKDITRSSKEGNRIKLIEGPKYSSGASYDDFKKRVFLDTKTGEKFNYNTLKNYLDSGKLEGVTYKSVIEPYDLKRKIATSGLREDIQKAYFGEKYQPPKMFRAQNTFHVHHVAGVGVDPFTTQLTFADQNLGLVHNKTFNREWAKLIERNAPLSERKNYLKFVKSKIGPNIAQTLEFPEVGKTRTYGEIGTDMQKLLSHEKFKDIDNQKLLKFFKDSGIPCIKGAGGTCTTPEDFRKGFNQLVKEAADGKGSAAAINKLGKFTKSMRALTGAAKWTGYGLLAEAGFMVPFAIGDYAAGESWKRILGNAADWGFGPMLGQSEQEEFIAALPEGSKAVEAEKALELGDRYVNLQNQTIRPQGRIGMDKARREKSRENVLQGIKDELTLNLDPFLSDTPWVQGGTEAAVEQLLTGEMPDQWHGGLWTQAHEDAADARARIAKEKLERLQKRRDEGTIAQEDWMVGGDTRGYMGGGIVGIRKPDAIPPERQGLRSIMINGKKS